MVTLSSTQYHHHIVIVIIIIIVRLTQERFYGLALVFSVEQIRVCRVVPLGIQLYFYCSNNIFLFSLCYMSNTFYHILSCIFIVQVDMFSLKMSLH